ncbi:MAG: ABC transporter substrate-binding protein [Bacteroidia bacterium]
MDKKLLKVIAICLLMAGIAGCRHTQAPAGHIAKGGLYYGGSFRMNWTTSYRSLFPLNVSENVANNITTQVYEGLVKFSAKDLSIVPCLAKKWELNDSTNTWTFHLRTGVKFHDDPCFPDGKGREVTAKDFKWCFDQLCTASPQNQSFEVTFKNRVVGADDYFQKSIDKKPLPDGGVAGVKVVNDSTLQIQMRTPFGGFLNLLAMPGCWVYPKEAVDKYGMEMNIRMIGTGPFMMKDAAKEDQAIVLVRNPNYWDFDSYGNQLPYLDAIKFSFVREKKSELLEFQQGNLEMMYQIPIEIVTQILQPLSENSSKVDYSVEVKTAMSSYFYGFLETDKLFSNKYLRQAFNYAIDRDKIVTNLLQGEGIPGTYGMVPPEAFKGYNYKTLKGYSFDPDKARMLMAKAGYPNGKGFPEDITLQTNSDGGTRNIQIAEVLQKMLKENLNISVKINAIPFPQHLDAFQRGKVPVFREEWIADYPDPGTFLNTLYGGNVPKDTAAVSYPNSCRYVNPKFDSLYVRALVTTNDTLRYKLYAQADQVALEDAPYMCIFYEENYYLTHNYVKNFYGNSMDFIDLSKVYIIPPNKRVSNNPNPTPSINQ